MKVLVTGASGFIGRNLCRHLLQSGWAVRAATRSSSSGTLIPSGAETVRITSVDGGTDWTEALGGVDAVVHLAARVHVMHESNPDPVGAFRTVNTEGTSRLAAMAAEAGARRIVYVSSIKVNGEQTSHSPFTEADVPSPDDAYGMSKWGAEQTLWDTARRTGLEVVVVRPPLVYGPSAPGNFNRLLKFIRLGIPLPLGSIQNQRSFMYIENLCDAIRVCLQHPAAAGRTFLLSDGEDVSTPELIRLLSHYLGCRSKLIPLPPTLLEAGASLLGFHEEAERLLGSLRVDSSAIRQTLHWTPPYSLREGLRATAEAYLTAQGDRRGQPATPPADLRSA
ncbi:MAG: NAD-dependent epimerase/dehydratase family protein [Acidobacteriota bacterium]|nr:NAD-dependent epimerase/dehydratase family protein [Acidobacteriota bacterium]